MQLSADRRGVYKTTEFLGPHRAQVIYELPLAEIVFDMYDKLKSITAGYGTMNYEVIGYRPADLVKMDILVKAKRSMHWHVSSIAPRRNANVALWSGRTVEGRRPRSRVDRAVPGDR